ncbi:hypothetical protein [Nocardioides sp.]|uniref:hypothetical protein n=1 Tax=Nocardioides sp. TaxID=35761 RepID=UPI00356B2F3E
MFANLIALDVPVGWSNPEDVDMVQAVLVLGGIPLLLFLGISLLVYVPSLVRGESIKPGAPALESQWLGGPRGGAAELTGSEAAADDTGGASGRW